MSKHIHRVASFVLAAAFFTLAGCNSTLKGDFNASGPEGVVALTFSVSLEGLGGFRITDVIGDPATLRYAESSCGNGTWQTFATNHVYGWTYSPGAGRKTLCVQLRDAAGNETPEVTVTLDVPAPKPGSVVSQDGGTRTERSSADAKDGRVEFQGRVTGQPGGTTVLQARLERSDDKTCFSRATKSFGSCDDAWDAFPLPDGILQAEKTLDWSFEYPVDAFKVGEFTFTVQAKDKDGKTAELVETFTWTSAAGPQGPANPQGPTPNPGMESPAKPAALAATPVATTTSLTLAWTGQPAPARFRLAYQAGPTAPGACEANAGVQVVGEATIGSAASYAVANLVPATVYSFRVCTVGPASDIATNETSILTAHTLPDTPAIAAVTVAGTDVVRILVDPAANPTATEVAVQVTFGMTTKWLNGGTLADAPLWSPATLFAMPGRLLGSLTPNVAHTFRVKARNAGGMESPLSPATSATPVAAIAPVASSLAGATLDTLTATWAASANTTGYTLVYTDNPTAPSGCTAAAGETAIAEATIGTATSHPITGLATNTHYTARVCAVGAYAEMATAASSLVTGWTRAETPGAPTVNTAGDSQLRVRIAQASNPSSTQYAVRMAVGAATFWIRASDGSLHATEQWATYAAFGGATGKVVAALTNGTTYTFAAKARNGANVETSLSATNTGVPTNAVFTITSPGAGASQTSNIINVAWSGAPSGITDFELVVSAHPTDCYDSGADARYYYPSASATSYYVDAPFAASFTGTICLRANHPVDGQIDAANTQLTYVMTRPSPIYDFVIRDAYANSYSHFRETQIDVNWTHVDEAYGATSVDAYELVLKDAPDCGGGANTIKTFPTITDTGWTSLSVTITAPATLPQYAWLCMYAKKTANPNRAALNNGAMRVSLLDQGTWQGGFDDPDPIPYPMARTHHAQFSAGGMSEQVTMIFGGQNAGGRLQNGYVKAPSGLWKPFADTPLLAARSRAMVRQINGRGAFIWGGYGASDYLADGAFLNARFASGDHQGEDWTAVSSTNAPTKRADALITHQDGWNVFGFTGHGSGGDAVQDDLEMLFVWGGTDGSALGDGAVYVVGDYVQGGAGNDLADTWYPMANIGAPSARYGHAGAWMGNHDYMNPRPETEYWLYVFGGTDGTSYYGDTKAFTPLGGTDAESRMGSWKGITATNAPSARAFHAGGLAQQASGDPYYFVVWGGFDGTNYLNDGKRLRLNVNTEASLAWVDMTTLGAPTARAHHATAFRGNTMIVWGGRNAGGALNDGGLYDAKSDTWGKIADPAAPWTTRHGPGSTFLPRGDHGISLDFSNGCDAPKIFFFGGSSGGSAYRSGLQSGDVYEAPPSWPWPYGCG